MADPRLQWRALNIAQPNVAGLMSGANDALNNAGAAAQGILERYDSGQKTKGDQELARLLASTSDRDALTQLVNSEAVTGLNLSEDGIRMLNEAQGNRVNWANTDSTIRDRDGRLVIAQNTDGRMADRHGITMREDGRMVSQRDWLEENSGQFFDAERQALTGGTSFSNHIDRTESGGGSDQYDTLYGHRNRQNGVQVSRMTLGQVSEFSDPNGQYAQSVNNEIGRVATPMGKFQIVGTTLRGIQKDLGLPDDVPFSPAVQEQMGLYLAQQRVNGPRSRETMRNGLRSEWEGFKNLSDAELDVMIDEIRAMPPVSRDSILAAAQSGRTQSSQTGFGGDGFTASMVASGQFTPQEILGEVDPLREAAQIGDNLIQQEDAQFTANLVTDLTTELVNDDTITPGDTTQIQRVLTERLQDNNYDSFEAAEIARSAIADLEENSVLMEDLNRGRTTEAQNLIIQETLNNTMKRFEANLSGQSQYDVLSQLPKYSEDPVGTLESELGIPSDGETRSDYNPEFLRNYMQDLVKEYRSRGFKVTPEIVAAAMRESFKVNPGKADEGFWLDPDLTRNTVRNRFDKENIDKIVSQLTPERIQEFNRARSEILVIEANLQENANNQKRIQSQINRLPAGDVRRENLQNRLEKLQNEAGKLSEKYRENETKVSDSPVADAASSQVTVADFESTGSDVTLDQNLSSEEQASREIEQFLQRIGQ